MKFPTLLIAAGLLCISVHIPFIETDGMKIASDELEYAIRNHPNSPEGFELMEEIDCFLPEKKLLRLDEKTIRMYMSA